MGKRTTNGFVQLRLGVEIIISSAYQALCSADVILAGSISKLRLLVINLVSAPGGSINSPTAQRLKHWWQPYFKSRPPLSDKTFKAKTLTYTALCSPFARPIKPTAQSQPYKKPALATALQTYR